MRRLFFWWLVMSCGPALAAPPARDDPWLSPQILLQSNEPIVSAALQEATLLIATDQQLRWYTMHGATVTPQREYPLTAGQRVLRVDLLDLTGDGAPEAIVTALRGERLAAFILTTTAGRLEALAVDLPWHLRVDEVGGSGRQILMQGARRGAIPHGRILVGRWDGQRLRRDRVLSLPREASLYGTTWLRDGDVATTSRTGRVSLWQIEQGRWRRAAQLPASITARSAQWLGRSSRSLDDTGTADVMSLPLPLLQGRQSSWIVDQQPAIGGVVGRTPLVRAATILQAVALPRRAAIPEELRSPRRPDGDGWWPEAVPAWQGNVAIMEWRRTGDQRVVVVVQARHDSPFASGGTPSRVLLLHAGTVHPAAGSRQGKDPSPP